MSKRLSYFVFFIYFFACFFRFITGKLLFENEDIFIIQVEDPQEKNVDFVDVEIFWRKKSVFVVGAQSVVKSMTYMWPDSGDNRTAIGVLWGELMAVQPGYLGNNVTIQDANFTVSDEVSSLYILPTFHASGLV